MRILFAEDDLNIATVAKLCLERIGGHSVVHVTDGTQAVALGNQQEFDLILLDGMMPNMDGYAAAQALLGSLALPPPIIFLTAKSDRADIERLSRIASGIISKPFEPRQLCAQIDAILAAWRERGA